MKFLINFFAFWKKGVYAVIIEYKDVKSKEVFIKMDRKQHILLTEKQEITVSDLIQALTEHAKEFVDPKISLEEVKDGYISQYALMISDKWSDFDLKKIELAKYMDVDGLSSIGISKEKKGFIIYFDGIIVPSIVENIKDDASPFSVEFVKSTSYQES